MRYGISVVLVISFAFVFFSGCKAREVSPKEGSYTRALSILNALGDESVRDRISSLEDVDALRIIAFTTRAASYHMEAGPDVEFDNQCEEVSLAAVHRLFIINSQESMDSISRYKKAFPLDGGVGLLFDEWERSVMTTNLNNSISE